jgi:hypothetical protein
MFKGAAVTITSSVEKQPVALLAVKVKVVVALTVIVGLAALALLKPADGVQL